MKSRSDNNRALHQPSVVGDPQHAEGAIPLKLDTGSPRQEMPSQSIQAGGMVGNQYPLGSLEAGVLSPDLTGDVPDPGVDPDDTSPNWDAVAPHTYPETGDPPRKTGWVAPGIHD